MHGGGPNFRWVKYLSLFSASVLSISSMCHWVHATISMLIINDRIILLITPYSLSRIH
jgi:hypothetical protein